MRISLLVMPQNSQHARPLVPVACLAAVMLFIVTLSSLSTVPRFESPSLNYGTVIVLAVAIPCLLFWLGISLRSIAWRWIVGLLAFVLSLPITLFTIFALMELRQITEDGIDDGFLQISQLQGAHSALVLYRTNGGATTSFGIVLRRERLLIPGLKLVTVLHASYPAYDATLELLPSGSTRLTVAPYRSGGTGEVHEIPP
jgi:hypothetical protein